MCVLIAKYFPETGWTAVKNRDRNYVPEINFFRTNKDGLERLLLEDEITGYTEGLNDNGIAVLTTSLMVIDDEKEVSDRTKDGPSRDGQRIKNSLMLGDIKDVVRYVVNKKLSGCIGVFNKEEFYLVECAYEDHDKSQFRYSVKLIPHDQTVARTNHGVLLPWAGYQREEGNARLTKSRISSEARLAIAEAVVKKAQSPQDMIDGLCQKYTDEPQLNAVRVEDDKKEMRTTGQIMITPSEFVLYYRPIASKMSFDFWDLNRPDAKTWVEILSARPLWQKSGWEALPTKSKHKSS
jgi:hypothetical protein